LLKSRIVAKADFGFQADAPAAHSYHWSLARKASFAGPEAAKSCTTASQNRVARAAPFVALAALWSLP